MVIEHRSVATFIAWAGSVFTAEEWSGVLASTSISFDLSVFELFATLSHGGTVLLANSALDLPTLLARDRVRLINTVPSAARTLLDSGSLPSTVRTINLAGEACPTRWYKPYIAVSTSSVCLIFMGHRKTQLIRHLVCARAMRSMNPALALPSGILVHTCLIVICNLFPWDALANSIYPALVWPEDISIDRDSRPSVSLPILFPRCVHVPHW